MTIDEIVEYTEAATEQLNIYLTKRIVDRILAVYDEVGVKLIPSSRRDIMKMLGMGKTLEEIEADINKLAPGMETGIRTAFVRMANEIEREQDGFLDSALVKTDIEHHMPREGNYVEVKDLYLTDTEKGLLESAYRRTKATFKNYTATTALSTQTALIDTLDEAFEKVTHGVSIHTATAEAIDKYSKIGTMVDFGGGVRQRLETVVTRAVRTGLAQASGDITLERCNTLDVEQVLVTSHIGARYTDKQEPANHMWWQGKVYDYVKEDKTKPKDSVAKELDNISKQMEHNKDESAGDFIKITGYGTGEGLCGWNCRHTFAPFFPGISINNQKDFDSEENKKRYDLEQKQRAKERKIRDLRRNYEALDHAFKNMQDGPLKDELRPKRQQAKMDYIKGVQEYNDWCKANKLRPKQERLKTAKDNGNLSSIKTINGSKGLDAPKLVKRTYDDSGKKKEQYTVVTDEYNANRNPGVGKVEVDDGLTLNNSKEEITVANILKDYFGGDIRVLKVRKDENKNPISTPDYVWNNKSWELKTISTAKAANSALRTGLKQINMPGYNPGGVILDCKDNDIDNIALLYEIDDRVMNKDNPYKNTDIIILRNNTLDKVLRY